MSISPKLMFQGNAQMSTGSEDGVFVVAPADILPIRCRASQVLKTGKEVLGAWTKAQKEKHQAKMMLYDWLYGSVSKDTYFTSRLMTRNPHR